MPSFGVIFEDKFTSILIFSPLCLRYASAASTCVCCCGKSGNVYKSCDLSYKRSLKTLFTRYVGSEMTFKITDRSLTIWVFQNLCCISTEFSIQTCSHFVRLRRRFVVLLLSDLFNDTIACFFFNSANFANFNLMFFVDLKVLQSVFLKATRGNKHMSSREFETMLFQDLQLDLEEKVARVFKYVVCYQC